MTGVVVVIRIYYKNYNVALVTLKSMYRITFYL